MSRHKDVLVYATASKGLHWLIALIVILMLSLSFFLNDLPELDQPMGYMIHQSCGLTVLGLMLLRVFWIHYRGRPCLPAAVPRWDVILSRAIQYSFYGVLIGMPICGWILSLASNHIPQYFGLFPVSIPGVAPNKTLAHVMVLAHKTMAWLLIALIVLHVAGALKHHFVDKDNVLRRMWFG